MKLETEPQKNPSIQDTEQRIATILENASNPNNLTEISLRPFLEDLNKIKTEILNNPTEAQNLEIRSMLLGLLNKYAQKVPYSFIYKIEEMIKILSKNPL